MMQAIEDKMKIFFEQANTEKKTVVEEKRKISSDNDPSTIRIRWSSSGELSC